MKARIFISMLFLTIAVTSIFSQEKTKKEIKEEKQLQMQMQTETLVNSQDFVFIAKYALPMGATQIDLTSNPNYVRFNPELMDGYMPFFGTATAGIGMGGDITIKFKDKPETFSVEKKKKNFFIDTKVKGEYEIYRLSLTVMTDGSASLSITSNSKGTISYQGKISASESIKYK
jgi:hypothetical protein